jgi:hypothetical protein
MFFSGCITRSAKLVNFSTGETLTGKFTDSPGTGGEVQVTMPDGEILAGRYSAVRENDFVTFGSAFVTAHAATPFGSAFGNASAFGSSRMIGGQGKAYGVLSSTKPGSRLMMELIATYGVLDGHGFGEARTNDGRQYRLQF